MFLIARIRKNKMASTTAFALLQN